MKVVYVAGRLVAPTWWGTEQNIRAAEAQGHVVAELGASPLIPHSNTRHFHGTKSEEFWYAATIALLLKCDAVFTVPGWENSRGATEEVRVAIERGIPVFHTAPSLAAWLEVNR